MLAPTLPSTHVYLDASGSFGCWAVCRDINQWFQLQWPTSWIDIGIAPKEFVPVVIAAAIWGPSWAGKHVCFHSDNEAVVWAIQSRSAKHHIMTRLLRCLFLYAAYFNFHYSATHIPGSLNTTADAISRNNLTLLYSLLPQVEHSTIPHAVLDLLVLQTPDRRSASWTELFVHSLPRASPPLLPLPTDRGFTDM